MEFIILNESSQEWSDIWEFVRNHPINQGLDEPCSALNNNLEWGYIGTFKNGIDLISEIVHDYHPKTNSRYKISFQHKLLSQESIGKSSRII